MQKEKIVKLLFMSENATQPVISQVAKENDVMLNVLHGNLTQTQNGAYGTLYVQVLGTEDAINASLTQLRQLKVENGSVRTMTKLQELFPNVDFQMMWVATQETLYMTLVYHYCGFYSGLC